MRGRGYAPSGAMLAVVVGVAGLGMCAAFLTTHATPLAFKGRLLQQQQRAGRQITMLTAANAGARMPIPSAVELFVADFIGIRTEAVARESWAWSHTAYNKESLLLQMTVDIEEQGSTTAAGKSLVSARRGLLHALIRHDYAAYVRAATALGGLIDRSDLPNVQQVQHPSRSLQDLSPQPVDRTLFIADQPLVPDCALPNVTFGDNALDTVLLVIFRKLVQQQTGYTSAKPGILGLLDEGREYMLRPDQTPEAQHKMVFNTLSGLLTPVMPPIYKTFMSGTYWQRWLGPDFGPWPWAGALTTWITPIFFAFLVGPSRPNRRKDGALGGLVVEKCKFLQESGCKGLCLNQCKLPAQQFFTESLGLQLTVSPNFETQECQWSFGETAVPHQLDPSFPKGCLAGCPTRAALRDAQQAMSCS